MAPENKILILLAHPALHKSRVNNAILSKLEHLLGITINNLYENYPDFNIDIKHEQDLLQEHDIIVWQHPFYWYSAPAILKEWIDLVLQHGFAYGRKGNTLKGKSVMNTITAGGRKEAYSEGGYNKFTINQFMAPYQQTARLCKMVYLPPFVIHGTHLLTDEQIDHQAELFRDTLIILRDSLLDDLNLMKLTYMNDIFELINNNQ